MTEMLCSKRVPPGPRIARRIVGRDGVPDELIDVAELARRLWGV
jgi:hypothetical protein